MIKANLRRAHKSTTRGFTKQVSALCDIVVFCIQSESAFRHLCKKKTRGKLIRSKVMMSFFLGYVLAFSIVSHLF